MRAVSPAVSTQAEVGKHIAVPLQADDPAFPPDVQDIISHAVHRWLKNDEVLSVLESFQTLASVVRWPTEAAARPEGGSLFAFSRAVCRAFRNDKHEWRKKNGT